MAFTDLLTAAQTYFPSLQVKYKDQNLLMQIIGKILFFTPSFMTDYTTTIGNTLYAPSKSFFTLHPVSGAVVFMHETVHLYDQNRIGRLWFQLGYMFPQILVLPALLLFLVSWKLAIPLIILFALPIPFASYWRMNLERRAYLSSIYTIYKLSQKLNFDPQYILAQRDAFVSYFINSSYYWMWPAIHHITSDFDQAIQAVQAGNRPYQDDQLFAMLDVLISKV
jgi:hypothetical protein